jgi:hypothetical protein
MIEYLFSINTGRAGSKYLTTLFECVENCASFHEAEPIMNGLFMKNFLQEKAANEIWLRDKMNEKIKSIEKLKANNNVYVETNHAFIKGFGWLLPDYIPQEKIGIIVIERDKNAVIESLYRIKCLPTNNLGQEWLMTPMNTKAKVKIPVKFSRLKYYLYRALNKISSNKPDFITQYEKKLLSWYIDELNYRAKLYVEKFKNIRVFYTTTEKLNDKQHFEELLAFFGINPIYSRKLDAVIGKKVNTKN